MVRVNLPPGCAGFADGDKNYIAKPGTFVNLEEDRDANALAKLRNQDYASAGLVYAGPQKEFISSRKRNGRWCRNCNFLGHSWMRECNKCGGETTPESERDLSYSQEDIFPEMRPLLAKRTP